jgi:hypothetical protein
VFDMRGCDWRASLTQANSQPAIVAYNRQGEQYILHSLQVFLVEDGLILRNTVYQDPEVLDLFDLPNVLP